MPVNLFAMTRKELGEYMNREVDRVLARDGIKGASELERINDEIDAVILAKLGYQSAYAPSRAFKEQLRKEREALKSPSVLGEALGYELDEPTFLVVREDNPPHS